MLPYLLVFSVFGALAFAYTPRCRISNSSVIFSFVLLLVFVGLRDQVGSDWTGYENMLAAFRLRDFSDIGLFSEGGFRAIAKLSDEVGGGLYGVNLLAALIVLGGLYAYAQTTSNPWLALAVVLPYLVFVVSMSGIRQAAAIGVLFYLLSNWSRWASLKKLFFIYLASTFHTSAVVMLIFAAADVRRPVVRLAIMTITALATIALVGASDVYEKYAVSYFVREIESKGAYAHVLLSAIPGVLYLVAIWRFKLPPNRLVTLGSIFAVASLFVVPLSTTVVDRVSLYLSFVQMYVYPALINRFPRYRILLIILVLAFSLLILIVFFGWGAHAEDYIPYNNVLTGPWRFELL